ncbi:MAG: hypothetical protein KDD82_10660, partial [Planctomycetes bacterium]|nr:hypothetical protein [Planctomycetota bacterium]
MSRATLSLGVALACVAGWSAAQDEADPLPEGYGERWITPQPAWRFSPGRPLEAVSASGVELARGDYLVVPAADLDSLEVLLDPPAAGSRLGPSERAQIYLWEQPDPEVTQADPVRQVPPLGRALLGVRLPTQVEVREGGVARLWADLGLRPSLGWFAVRAGEDVALAVRGLSLSRPPESWERLERALRAARDPEAPWPQVWRARETLPGREVESFLTRQETLLPWHPARDDTLARRTRVAGFQIESHVTRPRHPNQTRIVEWPTPEGALAFRDTPLPDEVWGHPFALCEAPLERTVVGPAVVRVRVRATWSHRGGPPNSVARFAVDVGELSYACERLVRADLRATGLLLDDDDAQQELAQRGLYDVVLSGWSEVRFTIPPGEHAVRVRPEGEQLWFAVESIHRTYDLHATAPFDELPSADELDDAPDDPRQRALAALAHELRGEYVAALAVYGALGDALDATPAAGDLGEVHSASATAADSSAGAAVGSAASGVQAGVAALDSADRGQLEAWVCARYAALAEALGDPARIAATRARLDALVEEGLGAPLDRWRQLALEEALRLWLTHELVPPPEPWARQGLDAPHLHPELYALVFRALAGLPDAGAERLPIAPAEPRDTRDVRALIFQTQLAARRRATSRYARLPRTHASASAAARFLLPVRPAFTDSDDLDPRAESAWQLAQTGTHATALLARATPLALEARSDEPISLLALGEGWRGGLSIEVEGTPRGELTHVSPWAPVELGLSG